MCESERQSSAVGATRDDYLRSIRCSVAYQHGFGQCDAPIPMSEQARPTALQCANGHTQTYSDEQLSRYRKALESLRFIRDGDTMWEQTKRSHIADPMRDWPVFESYWHPLNAFVLSLQELHNEIDMNLWYDVPEVGLSDAWRLSGFAAFFDGSSARLVDVMERSLGGQVDRYRLYNRLLDGVIQTFWGVVNGSRAKPSTSIRRSIKGVLAQLVPFAEHYLGADARRTRAIRRVSEMSTTEYNMTAAALLVEHTSYQL